MKWQDHGIILSTSPYGEQRLILKALTATRGVCSGMVHRARTKVALYQPGNRVSLTWSGRLHEHLGTYRCEMMGEILPHVLDYRLKLMALSAACELLDASLKEEAPMPELYIAFNRFLDGLEEDQWHYDYVRLELTLLNELGVGLDLSECAATGARTGLAYVSPKSGAAVSREAGTPYRDRLLKLPQFLLESSDDYSTALLEHESTDLAESSEDNHDRLLEMIDGLALTRYFLEKHVFESPYAALPSIRLRFADALLAMVATDA